MTEQPITWKELRDAVAALHEGLLGARHQANEAVWNPPDDRRLDRIYVDAYADLRFEVDGLACRAEVLVERMAETAVPARPLEAVFADIVGEGHGNIEVYRRARPARWIAKSDNGSQTFPGVEAGRERLDAYFAAIETGEAEIDGGDPTNAVVAAEARLAQIRELHAAKAANPLASLNLTLAREVRTIRGREVEFELDDAVGTWHFRCPAMHVVGGGQFTLEDAIAAAGEAIDFAMDADIERDRLNAIDREGRRREAEASEQGGAR